VRTTGRRSGRFAEGIDAPRQRPFEQDSVEEKQGAHRLVLGRGGDVPGDSQVREEVFDLAFAHLERMPLAVEEEEPLDPLDVGILGADPGMPRPERVPHALEQPGPTFLREP
jgi:hypothetical protein